VSFPQAASCFAQVLSMHLPQSVLPNDGGGGGAAAAELGGLALAVSAAGADDADAAAPAVSEVAGSAELADAELSGAGLSAGLDPPPHASQASGTATMRTRVMMGKWWARLMVFDCVARCGAESKHEV
jgi:hypothetical protein